MTLEISFRVSDIGPVARAFMHSTAFVRGIRGPVGSAKSTTCVMECLHMAMQQEPNAQGLRKTRGLVVRNTYSMLTTTTMKTWKEWLPEEAFGDIRMNPPPFEQLWNVKLPDRTELAAEVYFLALDRPEDVRKLLSLELTWAFGNEAREFPKTIVDGLTQRLRRYPRLADGGATRPGLIMDTNSPDDDHWWAIMSGDKDPPEGMSEEDRKSLIKPPNWQFFEQPPAMLEVFEGKRLVGYEANPEAENIANLDPAYYPEQITGKTRQYIEVYILNRYGATHEGRAVHPQFNKGVHVASKSLTPWPGVPLIIGADFGLTPAAPILQKMRGRYQVLGEVVLADGGADDLSAKLNEVVAQRWPGYKIERGWGDPSGDNRGQADKKTPFQVMRAAGIPCRPVETNDPEIRRGALTKVLTRLSEGQPILVIDPSCKVLIGGLEGAWCYKRVPGANEQFKDEPIKNRYSHVCEALEYAFVGEGEAREILGRKATQSKPVNARSQSNPLDRFNRARRVGAVQGPSWRR